MRKMNKRYHEKEITLNGKKYYAYLVKIKSKTRKDFFMAKISAIPNVDEYVAEAKE